MGLRTHHNSYSHPQVEPSSSPITIWILSPSTRTNTPQTPTPPSETNSNCKNSESKSQARGELMPMEINKVSRSEVPEKGEKQRRFVKERRLGDRKVVRLTGKEKKRIRAATISGGKAPYPNTCIAMRRTQNTMTSIQTPKEYPNNSVIQASSTVQKKTSRRQRLNFSARSSSSHRAHHG